ncbi:MAG: sodium:solute symporter family protein [Planctomycetes bacterium]|nr:sodium:solute symporter family protein [Planctomycetota bacterium]MCB9910645.1 sodium:solute symporter family protein [Planctomycetota bacterium]
MPTSNFTLLDWVLVAAYLLGTVAIGVYVNRFIHGMGDFVVAGRSLRTRLGIATMVGSELGLVTAMYSAQKGFTGGFAAFHIGVLAGIATLVVGFSGFIVVPLREMRIATIPEYYERRFGSRRLRIFGGAILALSGILNMGMFLKAGALFLTGLTGLHDPELVNWVMTAMIVLVLVYTALGGMVSVIITDYLQFVVLSIGLLLACGMSLYAVGWSNIVKQVTAVHGEAGFDPLHQSGFGPSYVTWMFFIGIISCAVWQTAVMRACAAESTAVVRRLYRWSSLGFVIRSVLPQFLGISAMAYLVQNPDLRAVFFDAQGGIVQGKSLEAMPVFLSQILPAGAIGLVGAGMLAAFMSTHDTYLLCWASVLVEDVVAPLRKGQLSQRARLLLTRLFLVAIAAFLLIWSMWYQLSQDLWDYMAVSGAIYFTGAFAVLATGIYWKRASALGAWLALLLGTSAILGLRGVQQAFGLETVFQNHGIEGSHIGLAAVGLSLFGMLIGSLLSPGSAPPATPSQSPTQNTAPQS